MGEFPAVAGNSFGDVLRMDFSKRFTRQHIIHRDAV